MDAVKAALTTHRNPPPTVIPEREDEEVVDEEGEDEYEDAEEDPPRSRRNRGGRSGSDRLEEFIDPPRPKRTRHRASETAMIPGEIIDWLIKWFVRLICLMLLSLTFVGTVLALNGGWNTFIPPIISGVPSWADPGKALQSLKNWNTFWMIMTWKTQVGIGIQIVITGIQFNHRTRKISFWYIMSMIVSAGLTYAGFTDIAIPMFSVFFALFMTTAWATMAAHVFLFSLSIGSDFVPEQALIK
jgi:hypothetical protein